MLTLPPQISDAERAVNAYKHELLMRVETFIVRLALGQVYVCPGDVPEDIVEKEHRQGVTSNAWNGLRSLEIIETLPLNFNDPAHEIFAGRRQNKTTARKDAGRLYIACAPATSPTPGSAPINSNPPRRRTNPNSN
jgi:hypothetical protein